MLLIPKTGQGVHEAFNVIIEKLYYCECPICTKQDRDMIYIGLYDEWYCIECFDNNRIWYPSHVSSEDRWQNDYINMYYEMKEKYEKKYLNKDKQNLKK